MHFAFEWMTSIDLGAQDDVAAMEWYERSAALACPGAATNLGTIFQQAWPEETGIMHAIRKASIHQHVMPAV